MYDMLAEKVAYWLRVPPEPSAPAGATKSLRVFRAAPNFYLYRRIVWMIGMVPMTLVFLVLAAIPIIICAASGSLLFLPLALLASLLILGLGCFITVVSYFSLRLDYENRWYKVTDRSLRIREGVFFVREMTMTFANIQNLSITQGPIQRHFGIADLKVEAAGGGGGGQAGEQNQQGSMYDMHTGWFRGVSNVEEIRDLMLSRLKRYRSAGLGDDGDRDDLPAEVSVVAPAEAPAQQAPVGREALVALLGTLRDEARGLRAAATVAAERRS